MGKSPTVKERFTALLTARADMIISSRVTSDVSAMPRDTMARESPSNIISTPASWAISADGKLCAVSIVMGFFSAYIFCNVWIVTAFWPLASREGDVGACELHRS